MVFATLEYDGKEIVSYVNRENQTFISLDELNMNKGCGVLTMQELIENYNELLPNIIELIKNNKPILLSEAVFRAPIPYPKRNIVCLGKNYLEHLKEIKGITGGPKDEAPSYPIYFTKAAYPCNYHNGIILRHPQVTEKIDYEVELVIVIGKKGSYIPLENALDYVFGYTIGNDISARDVQNRHVNWFMGKSLISHSPVGPYIVTKDEIDNPQNLTIKSYVNSELRQNGNTNDMIWGVAQIIYELSKGYELQPGDMIMTGTPKGVGMGFVPPKYLNPEDEIKCEIQSIGELINYIEK